MMETNALKILIIPGVILGIVLILIYMWSPREMTLVSKGKVPVYATQEDAMKTPPPPVIAQLSVGENVSVLKCVDVKHYLIYKVRLSDGRNGFVLDGEYVIMRDGKPAFCS